MFECKRCKANHARNPNKYSRFRGIRQDVRKHLRDEHFIKGLNRRNKSPSEGRESDQWISPITTEMESYEI